MDTTAEGDVYLPNGSCEKFSKPQALDKAGIKQVSRYPNFHDRALSLSDAFLINLRNPATAHAWPMHT